MDHAEISEISTNELVAFTQHVDLYQSRALNDNHTFGISSLQNHELAVVQYNERSKESYWSVETAPLNLTEAESLAADLHHQHYKFYIRNGSFHVIAWNLLDAHYICNLIALNDLGNQTKADHQDRAA